MKRVLVLCLLLLVLVPGTQSQWNDGFTDEIARGISERAPIGQVIGRLGYQGNEITYSTSSPLFTVNPTSGEVSLKEKLVYRKHHNLLIVFTARVGEDRNPIRREVQLKVLPINHPPEFDTPSYRFSVKDNVAVGTKVYDSINIIDFDQGNNGTVAVTCEHQACSYFDVTGSSVQGFPERTKVSLSVKAPLSLDVNTTLIRLRATDEGTPPLSSVADIDFVVENSRDSRPVFRRGPYVAEIRENDVDPNRDILTIEVADARASSPSNGIRLQVEEDVRDAFMIGTPTRISEGTYSFPIRQKKALNLIDNNFNSVYTFTVKAIQTLNGQDLPVVSESLVTMNIKDVNDQAPVFNPKTYSSSVPEGLANDATIPGVSILVSDGDLGDNGKYQLSLEPNNIFDVTPKNGQGTTAVSLIVKQPSLVRYSSNSDENVFTLTVKATETDTTEKRSSTATVTLRVSQPTNNRPPFFPNRVNPIFISDKTAVNTIISNSIRAEDSDTGVNGGLKYSIDDKDESRKYFNINPANGSLTLITAFDRPRNFEFDAIVTDGGGLSAFTPISIVVFNNEGPIFDPALYIANLTELSKTLVPEVIVKAQLNSLVSDKVIQYKLIDNQEFKATDYFEINQAGKITVKKEIDTKDTPDRNGILEFSVEASIVNDQRIPGNRAAVRIYVNDINNHDPIFDPASYKKVINETTPPNTPVLTVTATDNDSGINAQVNFFILEQESNAFEIEPRSGVIKTAPNAILRVQNYKMKVLAIDRGQLPRSSTAQVEIDVTDVVRDPPVYENPVFEFFIPEDAPIDTLIGSVKAKITESRAEAKYFVVQDSWRGFLPTGDPVTNTPVYTWFKLDPTDALLEVNNKLSYQLASRVTANIYVVVDNMEVPNVVNRANASVVVNILPVDSDKVVFSPSRNPYYFEVVEKQPIQTEIYNFVAFETKTKNQIRNFSLTSVSPESNVRSPLFFVTRETGILKVIQNIVFADLPNVNFTYELTARATHPSEASTTVGVVIRILPLSLNPVFEKQRYLFEANATAQPSTLIGKVMARTPYANQSAVIYSITNPTTTFKINSSNGEIRLQRPFGDQQSSYNLLIRAQSGTLSTNALVDVKVKRRKTRSPQFDNSVYNLVVPSGFSGPVGRVGASDPDPINPYKVIYFISSSTAPLGYFEVRRDSGIIDAINKVNELTTLVVAAEAEGYNSLISYVTVNIRPFTQTSLLPTFIQPNTTSIDLTRQLNGVGTYQVKGTSAVSNLSITYTIDPSSRDADFFQINEQTGLLNFVKIPIPEDYNSYQLVLKISDGLTSSYKRVNFILYGQGAPSFKCFSDPFNLTAYEKDQAAKPDIVIRSPSTCSDNHPDTEYFFKITKINGIDYDDSPRFYTLSKTSKNTIKVILRSIPNGLQATRLQIAVANSTSNLEKTTEASRLNATVYIDPKLFPPPRFESLTCGESTGKNQVKGILDLTTANSPITTMRAADCHEDPARPNSYTITKMEYKAPKNLYYGEEESGKVDAFSIDNLSGLVLTKLSDYSGYFRGYFDVEVTVTSPYNKTDTANLKVYVLRERQKRVIQFNQETDSAKSSFLQTVSKRFMDSNYTFVPDPVSTRINEDGSRDTSRLSVCYFTVRNSSNEVTVLSEEEFEKITKNTNEYSNAAGPCYRTIESTENWGGKLALWWVLIAFSILVFVIALLLACCICCFWPINMKQMAKARPYFVVDDPPMYAGTMNTTDSVFEHK